MVSAVVSIYVAVAVGHRGGQHIVFHCNHKGINSAVMCALVMMLANNLTWTASVPS
jgi:hypothetical protein